MKRLLVALDNSEPSLKAIDFAIELALKLRAELCLVNVISEETLLSGYIWDQLQDIYYTLAINILITASERAAQKGIEHVQLEIHSGNPADTIIAVAKHRQADMIVMGNHGYGQILRFLFGSVSHKVLDLAPCTVTVVR